VCDHTEIYTMFFVVCFVITQTLTYFSSYFSGHILVVIFKYCDTYDINEYGTYVETSAITQFVTMSVA
jgi:hypothetical protein